MGKTSLVCKYSYSSKRPSRVGLSNYITVERHVEHLTSYTVEELLKGVISDLCRTKITSLWYDNKLRNENEM